MIARAWPERRRLSRFFEAFARAARWGLLGATAFGIVSCRKLPAAAPVTGGVAPKDTDAICGQGFRWDGDHCSATAGDEGAPHPSGAAEKIRVVGGLRIEEVREGAGRVAKKGDTVRVHYTGALSDGTIFDSSRDRGSPLEFELGKGMVIKGFDRGVEGMREGAARRLTIPPELGYGERGMPPKIPPRSVLVFDIELVETL